LKNLNNYFIGMTLLAFLHQKRNYATMPWKDVPVNYKIIDISSLSLIVRIKSWLKLLPDNFIQPTEWEKIFTNDMTDKGLISTYINSSYNSTSKNQTTQFKKWAEELNSHFPKEEMQMATFLC